MALPGPNAAISLSQIQTEFGDLTPADTTIPLAGYGPYLPSPVPTTSQVGMTSFWGLSAGVSYNAYPDANAAAGQLRVFDSTPSPNWPATYQLEGSPTGRVDISPVSMPGHIASQILISAFKSTFAPIPTPQPTTNTLSTTLDSPIASSVGNSGWTTFTFDPSQPGTQSMTQPRTGSTYISSSPTIANWQFSLSPTVNGGQYAYFSPGPVGSQNLFGGYPFAGTPGPQPGGYNPYVSTGIRSYAGVLS